MSLTDRVAISVPLFPYDRWGGVDALRRAVTHADARGYWAVHIADHVVVPRRDETAAVSNFWYDNVTLCAGLAAGTRQIRFLFLVLVASHRHPLLVARQLATLDQLSAGRVVAGFGAGWLESEFEALGLDFATRGRRTDEHLDALVQLLSGNDVDFNGSFVQLTDVRLEPGPYRPGELPIWIGGNGRRAIDRVVRLGNGWAPTYPMSLAELRAGVQGLAEQLDQAGRSINDLAVSAKLTIGPTDAAVAEAARGHSGGRTLQPGATYAAAPILEAAEELVLAGATHLNVQFAWESPAHWAETIDWLKEEVFDV